MPKISIITTTYRHENFIARTIESILGQSFVDWKLLIGDDSPDDLTWMVIENYITKYPDKIHAWHHVPNKGIVENMNFLFAKVSIDSEYVAFLEGDDMWTPDYLEKKLDIWAQYPELGLIYNELSTIDEKGDIIEKYFIGARTGKWYKNEKDTIGNFLTRDMTCFSYSTLMVKKYDDMQIRDLGKPGLMGSETDFWVQIGNRSGIYGIEEPLTFYRKHQHNTSKDPHISISHYEYLIEYYFRQNFINQQEFQKLKILILMMRAFVSIRQSQYKQACYFARDCFRISYLYTLQIGINSLYYRLLKPFVFHLFSRL